MTLSATWDYCTPDNPCRLCGGTTGQLVSGAHVLCATRAKHGAPTPCLGLQCTLCKGTGFDPNRGMKEGQSIIDPSGAQLARAFPPCPRCQGRYYEPGTRAGV